MWEFCKASQKFGLLLQQIELSHPDAELRLLEVFYHKIYKVILDLGMVIITLATISLKL